MEPSTRVADWVPLWEEGRSHFHLTTPNPTLVKYFGKLTDGERGLKFFLPLCGKTLDLKWLSDRGQHVAGVEGVEIPCKQFFAEQGLEYSVGDVPEIPNGKVFAASSATIKIYQCDVLDINSQITGKFDVVWDRGSLVVMAPPDDREAYIKMLKDVTKPGAFILLQAIQCDYEEKNNKRPPYPLFRKDIDAIFGDWCTIVEEEREDIFDEDPKYARWGLTWITRVVFIMQRK